MNRRNKKPYHIEVPEWINKGHFIWAFVDWSTEKNLDLSGASDSEFDKYFKQFKKELR